MLDIDVYTERFLTLGQLVVDTRDGRRLDKGNHGRCREYGCASAAQMCGGLRLRDSRRSSADAAGQQPRRVVRR
jgi:hypothetical protein